MSTLNRYYYVIVFLLTFLSGSTGQIITADHFFRQGGQLQDQGDLSVAIDYYTEALKLNDKNQQALFNRALAYYQLEKPRKAIFDLNQLLALNTKDAEALELRAELHATLNQFDKALTDYSHSILIQPSVNRYLNRALLQADQKQFDLALQDIDEAIHLNPADAASHTVKADVLMAMGQVGGAIKGYGTAMTLDRQTSNDLVNQLPIETSANTSVLLNKAFYWIGKGQFDVAVLERLKTSSRSTDKAFALYCIGLIHLRQEDYQDAFSYFNKALTMDQSLGEYYYARGVALTYLHRFEEAQKDLTSATYLGFMMNEDENWLKIPVGQEQLLSENMDYVSTQNLYASIPTPEVQKLVDEGSFLLNTERYEQSLVLFNQAIHLDPNFFQPYLFKATAQEKLGQNKAAIQNYSVALELYPELIEGYYLRAMVYFNQKEWTSAKMDFDQVLLQKPLHPNALYMRAQTLAKMELWQAALKDYNDYLEKRPEDAQAYNNRGAVKMKLGLAFQALEDFNTGISLDDNMASLFVNRARVKFQLGAFNDALSDYNIALNQEKHNPAAYYERGLINARLQRYHQAIQDYTEAMKQDENEKVDYYYERALAFQVANAPEAAIADYNRVLELDKNRAEALYNRGIAKQVIADYQGARHDLSLASQLGKDSPNEVLSRQN